MLLMVAGASPGSAGGGLKTTTIAVLFAVVSSRIRNRPDTELWNRRVPWDTVAKAIASTAGFLLLVLVGVALLQWTECAGVPHYRIRGLFLDHLFEVISALCTVGLSMGATAGLTGAGKLVLIVWMFVGRVGPLVVANSLIGRQKMRCYTLAVCLDVRNLEWMEELNAARAGVVVLAMPKHFDVSVLITHYLAGQKTARIFVQVASDAEGEAITVVGATKAIFPEEDIALRIAGEVLVPGASDQIFLDRNLAILKAVCPAAWVGKSLATLELRRRHKVHVVGIIRAARSGEEREVDPVPDPSLVFEAGDRLLLLGGTGRLAAIRDLLSIAAS